jgi:catechol 2,3-dioxygenase-like lactoylglutathione lyase family enzyme
MSVPARVSLVTLGVRDLARATTFYEKLGWELSSASSADVSFFRTAGGLLALFPHQDLVADAALPADVAPPPTTFRGVTLAINLESADRVDAAMAEAERAGATVLKPPQPTEWGGYGAYFSDPDGHVWEVAHNPFWPIGDDERPQLP